jgi:HD-GYP domain-containing protein (c-di-GMP phosphodiesterase class II)
MTADRPYRRSIGEHAARAELLRGSGTQFVPQVVESFLAWLAEATEPLAA